MNDMVINSKHLKLKIHDYRMSINRGAIYMLSDVGVVVLNYITHEETKEMLASLKKYYPDVRTVVVDNGSPEHIVEKLYDYAKTYKNVTVLPLKENTGFARGNNAGIKQLREEGYEYIVCSNNDIVVPEGGVLEKLKNELMKVGTALAGPKIIGNNNRNQNPDRMYRPTPVEAKSIMRSYSYSVLIKKVVAGLLPDSTLKKYRSIKNMIVGQRIDVPLSNIERNNLSEAYPVYSLHGSFLMMGPSFFNYYYGFDEYTFLYGEEYILAEMILMKKLDAIYVPICFVIHKEDVTSDHIWTSKEYKLNKHKYCRKSVLYWYHNYYRRLLRHDG